jgi:hypothetical protein
MSDDYGKKSETEGVRGEEERPHLWTNTNGGENVGRIGEKSRTQRLTLNRKSRQRGTGALCAIGGIIDQLIGDAQKQLVKSRECVVWYQSEVRESEEKLQNLLNLKKLQEEAQAEEAQAEDDQGEEIS